MQQLIADISQYLKENTKKNGTLYSSCPEVFPKKGVPKPKSVISKKPLPKVEKTPPKKVEKKLPTKPPETPSQLTIQKEKTVRKSSGVDLKSFYNKFAPNLHVHETPKDDIVAKRAKRKSSDQKVLSDIVIFTDQRMANYQRLLSNLANAIDVKFQPCRLLDITPIEKEGRWNNIFSAHKLHLIILPDVVLFQSPKLIEYYKEVKEKKTLGDVPCFVLSNLDEVQNNPSTKKSLWGEITSAIGK